MRKAICDAMQHAKILDDDKWVLGGENYKAFSDEDMLLIKIYRFGGFRAVSA